MKNLIRFTAFIIALISILTVLSSCSEKGGSNVILAADFIVKTSDGKEISLYMQRDEVEELIGKGKEASIKSSYTADYEDFYLGYNEGLLTAIRINGGKCETGSGIALGISANIAVTVDRIDEYTKGMVYVYDEHDGMKGFSSYPDVFKNTEEMEKLRSEVMGEDGDYKMAAAVSCMNDKEGKITSMVICDMRTLLTGSGNMDEY